MPGILPQYKPKDKALDDAANKERQDRDKKISRAIKYRSGDHEEPLVLAGEERIANIIINVIGQIVDDVVDFMGIPSPHPRDQVEGDLPEDMVQLLDWIRFAEKVRLIIESGCTSGHSFVLLIEPEFEDDPPDAVLIDPRKVTVFWDATRVSMRGFPVFYRIEWEIGKTKRRQDIVQNRYLSDMPQSMDVMETEEDETENFWTIIEYEQGTTNQGTAGFVEKERDFWDYPFPPIVEIKNREVPHEYYGGADISKSDISINDAINFVTTNTKQIIKHHAHPKTIVIGADVKDLNSTPDSSLFSFPSPETKVSNIAFFSDISSSMQFANNLRSILFSQKRVIDVTNIKDKVGQLTNFGVRVLYGSMLDLIQSKRRLYGEGFKIMLERALFIMGDEEVKIGLKWSDPLPVNRIEQVQATLQEGFLGVTSNQTLARDLGRDYQAEQEQIRKEKDSDVTNRIEIPGQEGSGTNSESNP